MAIFEDQLKGLISSNLDIMNCLGSRQTTNSFQIIIYCSSEKIMCCVIYEITNHVAILCSEDLKRIVFDAYPLNSS